MSIGQRLAQALRVGKPRRRGTPATKKNRLSVAQCLPDELILSILSNLSHDGLLGQHTYPISHLADSSYTLRVKEASLCQQGLYSATLSCKSWYPVGVELLYSAPFILTKRRVELLLRTLTTCPHLANYVNDLYAPLITRKSALAWLQNSLSIKSATTDTEEAAHLVARLTRTTSLLSSLNLKHVVPSGHISTIPLSSFAFPSELEHLSIHGTSFESRDHPQLCLLPSHDADISFETLKTLCIRDMYILPTVKFPRMPLVSRIALVQNHYFQALGPEGAPPLLTADMFPSLRRLDIYGDDIPFSSADSASLARVADPSVLRDLQAFSVIQAIGHLEESLSLVSSSFDVEGTRLRKLTIGVVGAMDCAVFEKWRIPREVERLTVLLACGQPRLTRTEVNNARRGRGRSGESGGREEGKQLIRSVIRCLEGNVHSGSALRELCLVVGPGVLRASDATKVQSLCSSHKTGLSVVYQDPDSCVADMLMAMEKRTTRSAPNDVLSASRFSDAFRSARKLDSPVYGATTRNSSMYNIWIIIPFNPYYYTRSSLIIIVIPPLPLLNVF
ncbi:hypothetical protein BDY19DRAFT_932583 [Irpex rosettiformis]|uniref:Uncharacterized protein n=1 Tax=Irpex rosettiformis TaxID=378272 RepID=A0ACB8U9L6_9APHY|nr:hypothetical protein BDY19DRAFT_932583 [Irpex rosettiformis]